MIETLVIAGLILALVVAVRPRRRRRRHSWFYDWYMRSHLWKIRRWLWYWTSNRKCEKCRTRMVLHARGVRYRMGAPVATFHHTARPGERGAYKHLGRESRRRGDIHMLCWPCHSASDAWRHR